MGRRKQPPIQTSKGEKARNPPKWLIASSSPSSSLWPPRPRPPPPSTTRTP
uniref:Ccp1 n=1 Tax=Arundo donax TaxID=35708 RepID=A0A0A8XXQ4_ARUDO